jgi:hypothetical protein
VGRGPGVALGGDDGVGGTNTVAGRTAESDDGGQTAGNEECSCHGQQAERWATDPTATQVDQAPLLGHRGERFEDLLGDPAHLCGRLACIEPAPKPNVEVVLGGHAITCAVGNSSSRSSDSRIARVA